MKGSILAALAGICGALASLTGKLIGYRTTYIQTCTNYSDSTSITVDCEWLCWYFAGALQAVFVILTLILNSVMWTVFVESMQYLGSSEAMVLNIGTNIFVSAMCGWLFFAEHLTITWWLGACFIISGLSVLMTSSSSVHNKTD